MFPILIVEPLISGDVNFNKSLTKFGGYLLNNESSLFTKVTSRTR